MKEDKFSGEMPKVMLVPKPRRIEISCTPKMRAYALYDTKTGVQVKDFIKCDGGKIEFNDLDPNMHYDVGFIENIGDEKPQFAINWTADMRDNTDAILNNSNDLPVLYPDPYLIKYKDDNSDGVYDLVDDKGKIVGQVTKLYPQEGKPEFRMVYSFRMKDDTVK